MINLNDKTQNREIRIFVSSTFRDLLEERDYLVKNVFPNLRKLSQARGVELTEVDLRWGVTESQAEEGKVIEICLREIDRCRPYFIGILGDRYGWVPPADEYTKHRQIVADFPWVKADIDEGLSITEMEIQYGVLRNADRVAHAFFYLRDSTAKPKTKDEGPDAQETKKLARLKALLQTQSNYPCHPFNAIDDLANLIEADFQQFLDSEFPLGEAPSPFKRASMDHAAFARSRLKIYLGGEEYLKRLDAHAGSTEQPLVVTGESGSGKSALLANWIARQQHAHPEQFIFYHFVGGAPDSSDHVGLVRRLMEGLRQRFNLAEDIPIDPEELLEMFPHYLSLVPQNQRWVLVIDALNQLEYRENARWLGWLPTVFPDNVRVILSTLPGDSLDALARRNYPQLQIKPIDLDVRKALIRSYLKLYTKELREELVEQIASAPLSHSPLILHALLDELRVFGVHEALEERINYYLQPQTPNEFFDAVLSRLEVDYESARPGMVGEILSLLWASRRGLSERELLEVTGIPPLFWTPLYNALESHLVNRSGLLDFFHDFLRQGVQGRYLPTADKQRKAHQKLADYFELDGLSERGLDEWPYQLQQAEVWVRFKDCLGNLDVFWTLSQGARVYELLNYWHAIGDNYDMETVYCDALDQYSDSLAAKGMDAPAWQKMEQMLRRVASFFGEQGNRYGSAVELYESALEICDRELGSHHEDTSSTLNSLGLLLTIIGDLAKAEPYARRALELDEQHLGASHLNTASAVNNLGMLLYEQGKYAEAEPLYRRSLEIDEKHIGKDHPLTATSLNNLAGLLSEQGKNREAEAMFRRALDIRERKLGPKHPDTAGCLNNLGLLIKNMGKRDEAKYLFQRALDIYQDTLGSNNVEYGKLLNNMGAIYQDDGEYALAEQTFNQAVELYESTLKFEHSQLASTLHNLAALHVQVGELDKAEAEYQRVLEIDAQTFGAKHAYSAETLANLGSLLKRKGDYEKAEAYFRQALEVRESVFGEQNTDTLQSVIYLAQLLFETGNTVEAETLYRRAVENYDSVLGNEDAGLATLQNNLALLLNAKGDRKGAEPLFRLALSIREKVLGIEHAETDAVCHNLAMLLLDREEYEQSETLFLRSLDVREKLYGEESWQLASTLTNLAVLYRNQQRLKEAERLNERALSVYGKTLGDDHPSTVNAGTNLAVLKFRMGKSNEASELCSRHLHAHRTNLEADEAIAPKQLSKLAECYFHLAQDVEVPEKRWVEAEQHYKLAIEYYQKLDDEEGVAKAERQLQALNKKRQPKSE